MDWDAWARRAESALDFEQPGRWRDLFADGAEFGDPQHAEHHRPPRGAARHRRHLPGLAPGDHDDPRRRRLGGVRVDRPRDLRGTRRRRSRSPGTPIEMHGASIVEVDGDGLVTKWADYLDRKEPEVQLRAAAKAKATGRGRLTHRLS